MELDPIFINIFGYYIHKNKFFKLVTFVFIFHDGSLVGQTWDGDVERGTDNDNLLSNNCIFYAGICLVILLFPAKESFKMVLRLFAKTPTPLRELGDGPKKHSNG